MKSLNWGYPTIKWQKTGKSLLTKISTRLKTQLKATSSRRRNSRKFGKVKFWKSLTNELGCMGTCNKSTCSERVCTDPPILGHLQRGGPLNRPPLSKTLSIISTIFLIRETVTGCGPYIVRRAHRVSSVFPYQTTPLLFHSLRKLFHIQCNKNEHMTNFRKES